MIQKIRRDKKGVSPVIGVILMVAATIVIAAVVIAMLGGFTAPKGMYAVVATAEVRVNPTSGANSTYVTYMGGPDADQVDWISANTMDSQGGTYNIPSSTTGWGTTTTPGVADVTVGSIGIESAGSYTTRGADDHVTVTATFIDGSSQVILETWL